MPAKLEDILDGLRAAEATRDYSSVCQNVSISVQLLADCWQQSMLMLFMSYNTSKWFFKCAVESLQSLCIGMLALAADTLLFLQP